MATVEVDQETCIADQICASMHPDIFEMGADGFAHVVDGMAELDEDESDVCSSDLADACRVDAISVSE